MSRRKDSGRSVFQRGDGRWVLTYQPEPGAWKQHALGFLANEREANRKADTWLAEQRSAGTLPALTRTINEAADAWVKLRAAHPDLKGSTIADNRSHVESYIKPKFGKLPIGKLTATMLRAWVREIRDTISPSTLRNIMNTFSAFYEDARAEGWVKTPSNVVREPAVLREMPSFELVRQEIIVVSLDVAQRLIADERVPEHRRVRYALGFMTGLRDGEIAGLTWGDLEFGDLPILHVRRALAFKAEPGQHASLTTPKTKSSKRPVPMHPALVQALTEWRDGSWHEWSDTPIADDAPIFPSPRTGKHWRPRSAEELRADLATLGLPTTSPGGLPIDFHATRRSLMTWLAEFGVEDSLRDRIVGHEPKTTGQRHYTGALLQRMADALALVPLRWGQLDPPAASGSVPPSSSDPHSANPVHPHNEGAQNASAPVAQWIEQRFPKTSPASSEVAETLGEDDGLGSIGAQGDERDAALARGEARAARLDERREPYAERLLRLEQSADDLIGHVVEAVSRRAMSADDVARLVGEAQAMLRLKGDGEAVRALASQWDALERVAAGEGAG